MRYFVDVAVLVFNFLNKICLSEILRIANEPPRPVDGALGWREVNTETVADGKETSSWAQKTFAKRLLIHLEGAQKTNLNLEARNGGSHRSIKSAACGHRCGRDFGTLTLPRSLIGSPFRISSPPTSGGLCQPIGASASL